MNNGLRPLSIDFEDAGTIEALLRTCRGMADEFDVPHMPSWILDGRIELVIGSDLHVGCKGSVEMLEEAREVVPHLAALERTLLTRLDVNDTRQSQAAQSPHSSSCVHTVCLARLLLGACCEAFAALRSSEISKPGTRPQAVGTYQEMARLYKDSCHAAVWTSAHAHYIHDLLTYGITVDGPSIYSSENELAELDLSELYSHRFSSRQSDSSASNSLLSLMTRCTNPGSRGWDGILSTTLEENTGTKRICCNALMISLTGMNSCIHPALRLHWKSRLELSLHLGCKGLFNQMLPLCNHPTAFKECVRRMVSNTTSSAYASNSALAHLEHPVAFLSSAPFQLPTYGLECSSNAFANAGRMIYESRGSTGIQDAIKHAFARMNPTSSEEAQMGVLQWNPGYLGERHSNYTFPFPVPLASACAQMPIGALALFYFSTNSFLTTAWRVFWKVRAPPAYTTRFPQLRWLRLCGPWRSDATSFPSGRTARRTTCERPGWTHTSIRLFTKLTQPPISRCFSPTQSVWQYRGLRFNDRLLA